MLPPSVPPDDKNTVLFDLFESVALTTDLLLREREETHRLRVENARLLRELEVANDQIMKSGVTVGADKPARAPASILEGAIAPLYPDSLTSQSAVLGRQRPFPDQPIPLWHILDVLSGTPDANVVSVRKIHKLGDRAASKLREYFHYFGRVSDVLLLNRRARSHAATVPPNVAFVVMESAEAVQRILDTGFHEIAGLFCELTPFDNKYGAYPRKRYSGEATRHDSPSEAASHFWANI